MWCGMLAALVLTVETARTVGSGTPRFSELSLLCVIALLAGGLTGALVAVDSVSQLSATGYGRVLLIKIVLTLVLITLASRDRADGCRGKVAPRHRLCVTVQVADRAGDHDRGLDHGRRTVRHRLAEFPTWHDGTHCRVMTRTRHCKGAARWQTSRIDPTKNLTPHRPRPHRNRRAPNRMPHRLPLRRRPRRRTSRRRPNQPRRPRKWPRRRLRRKLRRRPRRQGGREESGREESATQA